MGQAELSKDPYNIIITGVGGQGNVLASRILGNMLVRRGLYVTIGETFGASQRGGSVMSHLRVSKKSSWSPQIPKNQADMILALEPSEAVRLLPVYGHQKVKLLSNSRAILPVDVIAGNQKYPTIDEIKDSVKDLTEEAWFINATEEALKLGNPIFGNSIMLGALAETNVIPMSKDDFEAVISESMPPDTVETNLTAYDLGGDLVRQQA